MLNADYKALQAILDREAERQAARNAARLDRLARQELRILLGLPPGHDRGLPMIAYCMMRETARRVMFLRAFIESK